MALRIKDNVDLKELEKFGFKTDEYNLWYEYHTETNYKDCIMMNTRNKYIGLYQTYNGYSYGILYDLIKADLVEKVEEE